MTFWRYRGTIGALCMSAVMVAYTYAITWLAPTSGTALSKSEMCTGTISKENPNKIHFISCGGFL